MPADRRIHIQRLVIRTRGLPESTVRTALAGLDTALQVEAARHPNLAQAATTLDHLDPTPVRARGDSQQLRQAIAQQVMAAIAPPSKS